VREISLKNRITKKKELRGEKLRKLIFLVYLNNEYGKGSNNISELEEIVGYSSPGGIYDAINNSGYFNKTVDGVVLTEIGKKYLEREILSPYKIANTVSYAFIFFGVFLIFQWAEWIYGKNLVIIPWYSGLIIIVAGLGIRFLLLRLNYWFIKKTKNVSI
jgi:hypothetical protein